MINTLNYLFSQKEIGISYLDACLNVLAGNQLFSEILMANDGLTTSFGKLQITDRIANTKFHSCYELILGDFKNNDIGESLYVPRNSGLTPYKLQLIGFDDEWHNTSLPAPSVLLFVKETEKAPKFPKHIFQEYYQLTNTEALLAEALFKGSNLAEFADLRGIKVSTVRWTLDNIFSKTYTHSQRELSALIFKLAI